MPIIINIILIPQIGFLGAGISSLISYLLMFLIILYKNQAWLKNNFIDVPLVFLGFGGVVIVVLGHGLLYTKVAYFLFFIYFVFCFGKLKNCLRK